MIFKLLGNIFKGKAASKSCAAPGKQSSTTKSYIIKGKEVEIDFNEIESTQEKTDIISQITKNLTPSEEAKINAQLRAKIDTLMKTASSESKQVAQSIELNKMGTNEMSLKDTLKEITEINSLQVRMQSQFNASTNEVTDFTGRLNGVFAKQKSVPLTSGETQLVIIDLLESLPSTTAWLVIVKTLLHLCKAECPEFLDPKTTKLQSFANLRCIHRGVGESMKPIVISKLIINHSNN